MIVDGEVEEPPTFTEGLRTAELLPPFGAEALGAEVVDEGFFPCFLCIAPTTPLTVDLLNFSTGPHIIYY
jgi:hypothetical protein